MTRKPSDTWPKRPKGFYDDWTMFCCQALSARLQHEDGGDDLAVVLLAGGAILGGLGMITIVAANQNAIDAKGKEWGIEKLSTIAGVGSAMLGATVGGLGVAWLTRTLGRHADVAKVDALQARLATARREFESLKTERSEGRLNVDHHRAAVERLFMALTEEPA
jgi:hypothetical protein